MDVSSLRLMVILLAGMGVAVCPVSLLADQDEDLGVELAPIEPDAAEQPDPESVDDAAEVAPEPAGERLPTATPRLETTPVQHRERPSAPAHSPFEDYEARVRFSAEHGLRPPAEGSARIGLFGVELDVRPHEDWWHLGAGVFGAATGNLGGLFGGGLHGGVRIAASERVALEAGAMIGAGGGSGAPVGSGLFLRPRGGLHIDLKGYGGHVEGASVNLSRLYFPTGDFNSMHLSISFELAAPTPLAPGLGLRAAPRLSEAGYGASNRAFRATGHSYFLLPERSLDAAGESLSSPRLMVGLEYREFFSRHVYGLIEPRAMAVGGSAGFAELTVGGGFAVPLDPNERVSFFGSGGIGGAGGGGIRTGGGVYLRGALGIDVDLPGPYSIGFDAGIQDAPRRGSFTAISTGLRLGISQEVLRPRAYAARSLTRADEIVAAGWRLRPFNSTFFSVPENDDGVIAQLAGLRVDHMLGDHAFVSMQGAASYAGLDRAALAIGTFGLGGITPEWNRIRLTGEARLGAAGGGGVGVGSGLVMQPAAGAHVAITDAVGLDVLAGFTIPRVGALATPMMEVGLTYSFSTPRVWKD